jgi:hypothetical protein
MRAVLRRPGALSLAGRFILRRIAGSQLLLKPFEYVWHVIHELGSGECRIGRNIRIRRHGGSPCRKHCATPMTQMIGKLNQLTTLQSIRHNAPDLQRHCTFGFNVGNPT